MDTFFSSSAASPLQTLSVLEDNLKRERRAFSFVVGLLAFSIICIAWVVVFAFMEGASRREQESIQVLMHNVSTTLALRQSMLTVAHLQSGQTHAESGASEVKAPASLLCTRHGQGPDQVYLHDACDQSVRLISKNNLPPAIEFALWDGSVSYGAGFWESGLAGNVSQRLSVLVNAARNHLVLQGIDPLSAAQTDRSFRFPAPAELGFSSYTTIVFSVVTRDGQPYALVFTNFPIQRIFSDSTTTKVIADIAVFDARNNLIAGVMTPPILYVQKNMPLDQEAHFHWKLWHGWGSRVSLPMDLGTVTFALPGSRTLPSLQTELLAVFIVVAALLAALLAMYRYWNRRYLTRTYEEARRGLEGEILNHLLVHATPVGLCIVLRNDFRILAANQNARDVLGLDDNAARLPLGLCEAFEQPGITPGSDTQARAIKQFQFSLTRSRELSPLHLKISYAPASVNKTDVLFCAIADMTEQHEAENLLREAKETTEQSARARLGFFAAMSHEIRTPLASLMGNLELVAHGALVAEQEARVLAMQASAQGLLQVVNDVLDFSKMDIGEMRLSPEWQSLREVIVLIAAAHVPLANRQGLRLYVTIDRHCPDRLLFDAIRVSQILNNLLGNAFKFTPSGKVTVRAAWVDNRLQLTVADSGVGIPDALRARLFQPFTQGEGMRLAQASGTGLGLAICARLCALMHGEVKLESIEGIGSRVEVTLPLTADESYPLPEQLKGSPAIYCRAAEYREWFDTLYDPANATPVWVTPHTTQADLAACDYLVVTDEFVPEDIARIWPDSSRVLHATQGGPLVPAPKEDGSLQVSIFSIAGVQQAVQKLGSPDGTTETAAIDAEPDQTEVPDFSMVTVLIAEDNKLNRALLRDQLQTLGAHVLDAADGEEALALLQRLHVDLVLTDLDMPRMNGIELLAQIRKHAPELPVYAVSASASSQDIEQGHQLGFTDYLTKPLSLSVLRSVLVARRPTPQASADADSVGALPSRFPHIPDAYLSPFLQQIDEDLLVLDTLSRSRDMQGLARWAHKMVGGLSVLGASMLLDQCEELQDLLHCEAPWEDIEVFTTIMHDELSALKDAHAVQPH
ncbi:two-component system capsular synthesis sensor histidine kinase RcsC [Silvimonas terrae]|uniref:histidine kinase n=1 Tax=Silvimonas terrae TaxID=300266 RepID=A0A840RHP1_9NEIS|nr:hybrid sensor histidine kinase/response regulator [Silvimonas terrae]MBB5191721.1 two-component system capsular synthesis sensor histidine kinase RcsC [Silvimonas terrae]